MLEEIALSISTLVFFLCTFVVNSMIPDVPAEPSAPVMPETVQEVFAETDEFELVGEWNSGGRIFEFTGSGKLLYNGQIMPYELDGSCITVISRVDGAERTYRLTFEPVSERIMRLNGVTMYKTSR